MLAACSSPLYLPLYPLLNFPHLCLNYYYIIINVFDIEIENIKKVWIKLIIIINKTFNFCCTLSNDFSMLIEFILQVMPMSKFNTSFKSIFLKLKFNLYFRLCQYIIHFRLIKYGSWNACMEYGSKSKWK